MVRLRNVFRMKPIINIKPTMNITLFSFIARIGAFSFSLSNALKRLGVSEDRLRRTIKDLELGKLKINNIETVKNTLLLKVLNLKNLSMMIIIQLMKYYHQMMV